MLHYKQTQSRSNLQVPTLCPGAVGQCRGTKVEVTLHQAGGNEPEDMARSSVSQVRDDESVGFRARAPKFKSCLYHVTTINLGNLS